MGGVNCSRTGRAGEEQRPAKYLKPSWHYAGIVLRRGEKTLSISQSLVLVLPAYVAPAATGNQHSCFLATTPFRLI